MDVTYDVVVFRTVTVTVIPHSPVICWCDYTLIALIYVYLFMQYPSARRWLFDSLLLDPVADGDFDPRCPATIWAG